MITFKKRQIKGEIISFNWEKHPKKISSKKARHRVVALQEVHVRQISMTLTFITPSISIVSGLPMQL